jgi:hypothetical protein
MKRVKRLTKRERKDLDPTRPEQPQQQSHQHIHCIACGRHIEPAEFNAFPPKSVYLTCEHKHDFPSCADCQVTARYLIAEHERTGNAVQMAQAWH